MSSKLTDAMYATMPVKPINIRVTNYQLQPNSRRRRQLLQVSILSCRGACVTPNVHPTCRPRKWAYVVLSLAKPLSRSTALQ